MKKSLVKNIDSLKSKSAVPNPVAKKAKTRFALSEPAPYILIAAMIAIVLAVFNWNYKESSPKKTASTPIKSVQAAPAIGEQSKKSEVIPASSDGKLPAYTLIQPAITPTPPVTTKSPSQQSPLRITIVTQDRDEQKLIALNDSLLKQYKAQIDPKRGFFIDYFDSKEIAAYYFKAVADSKTDKATKAELYKHYIAIMVDSEALKMNQLYLQGNPVKSLKQY